MRKRNTMEIFRNNKWDMTFTNGLGLLLSTRHKIFKIIIKK
jgi:hypothetical protein